MIILCLSGGEEETDLIYEGIATINLRSMMRCKITREETDLIYEGIATIMYHNAVMPSYWQKKLT